MRNWIFPYKPNMTEEELYRNEKNKIFKTCDNESRINSLCLTRNKKKRILSFII